MNALRNLSFPARIFAYTLLVAVAIGVLSAAAAVSAEAGTTITA